MNSVQKLYVLGHPVSHSLSPIMHNALYRELGLHWQYNLMDCKSEQDAKNFIDASDFLGINITTPYKPLSLECAKWANVHARLAGGANVYVRGGRAYNVDGLGCVRYLQKCGIDFENERVVVCGSGPTSLSIMHAALCAGAPSVSLLGRNSSHVCDVFTSWKLKAISLYENVHVDAHDELCDFSKSELDARLNAGSYSESVQAIQNANLIIDATPLGMNRGDAPAFDTTLLQPETVVMDVVYGHGQTALERGVCAAGCKYIDGRGMLVAQAVLSAHVFMHSCDGHCAQNKIDFDQAFEIMESATQL